MYIGQIFEKDLNFPIEKDLVIVYGSNGSGKTLTLLKLKEYFENEKENVIYFPYDRIFNLSPDMVNQVVNGFLVMEALLNKNENERFNRKNFDYDMNNLKSYYGRYISSGIIQWINFMGNILIAKNPIVIIDTPETNLDIFGKRNIIKDILSIGNVKKLIVCTHSPEITGDNLKSIARIGDFIKLY